MSFIGPRQSNAEIPSKAYLNLAKRPKSFYSNVKTRFTITKEAATVATYPNRDFYYLINLLILHAKTWRNASNECRNHFIETTRHSE